MLSQLSRGDALPGAGRFSALTPFERFEFEPRFALDTAELERRYLDFSRRLHPDMHSGKSAKELRTAVLLTASLNEAYGVLKDEFKRAELLLGLIGGASSSDDRRTPPGFLMEMLELREELENAREAGDEARGRALLAELQPRRDRTMAEVAAGFAAAEADLEGLRLRLNTLKYHDNMIDELRGWLD